jgi:hypothetical protein
MAGGISTGLADPFGEEAPRTSREPREGRAEAGEALHAESASGLVETRLPRQRRVRAGS